MHARLVRLDTDDLMHPDTGEENYNESAYYNFYDPACGLGGFARPGNRPNERRAGMTEGPRNRGGGTTTRVAEGRTEWHHLG